MRGLPIGPMAVSNKAYGTIKMSGDINQFHNCFGKNTWHAARK